VTGNSLYRKSMRRVVIHESGHATFYGAIPDECSIKEVSVTVLSGHVMLFERLPDNFRRLVGCLAGLAAEKVILGTKNVYFRSYESSDMSKARCIASIIGRKDYLDIRMREGHAAAVRFGRAHRAHVLREGKAAAERFARANREQIEAVARTLRRLGDVDGSRIMARLNQLPPLTAIPPREIDMPLGVNDEGE
jgi:hypothetical protein